MLQKEPLQLGFLLRSVYDLLPTSVNLKRRYKTERERVTTVYYAREYAPLNMCYDGVERLLHRWGHDKVLEFLAAVLDPLAKSPKKNKVTEVKQCFINQKRHQNRHKTEPESSRQQPICR